MTPVQMHALFMDIAEKIVQARGRRAEPLMQVSCEVPYGTLEVIHDYARRLHEGQVTGYGNFTSIKYCDCVTVSQVANVLVAEGDKARKDAYANARKVLDLHEAGYAVREYCLPEDEFRFVWHGKRYLTTSKGVEFSDVVVVQDRVCIHYSVLKNVGEPA